MSALRSPSSQADLTVATVLAQLLERLDQSPTPVDPDQYRSVARRLRDELARLPAGDALSALLQQSPATAELYENLQYEHAGLCRAPLERSLNTEMQAREVIARAQRAPAR